MIRSIKSDIASLIDIINSDLETIHRIGRLSATLRMERKWKGPLWWDEIMDQTCLKHFEYHKQKYIDVIKTIRENHKDLLVHLAIYLRRIEAAIDAMEEKDPQKLTKVRQSLIETFKVLEAANPNRCT